MKFYDASRCFLCPFFSFFAPTEKRGKNGEIRQKSPCKLDSNKVAICRATFTLCLTSCSRICKMLLNGLEQNWEREKNKERDALFTSSSYLMTIYVHICMDVNGCTCNRCKLDKSGFLPPSPSPVLKIGHPKWSKWAYVWNWPGFA